MNKATEKQQAFLKELISKLQSDAIESNSDIDIIKFYEIVEVSENLTVAQASKLISMAKNTYSDLFIERLQDYMEFFNEDTQAYLQLFFSDSFDTPEEMVHAFFMSLPQSKLESILEETHEQNQIAQDAWTIRFGQAKRNKRRAKERVEAYKA